MIALSPLGCDKVDIKPDKSAEPFEINEETGYMRYNEALKDWCISLYIPDNIDSHTYFYSDKIEKSFKQEDLRVKFSGKAVRSTFKEKDAPCCREYYCITITQLEELK